MSTLSDVPDSLDDFLLWMKDRTEAAWASHQTKTLDEFEDDGVGGSSWRTGTEWQIGLTEPEIDAIEQHWGLKFPTDYRRFLSVLNAPDRGAYCVGWSDDPPYGMAEDEDAPTFFDWRKDDVAIKDALDWLVEGLVFDVEENELWPDSWGQKPTDPKDVEKRVSELVAAAPSLIPITGHRYLLANSPDAGNPVLSVWQSDIICYGSNLKNFLTLELSGFLGLDHREASEIANADMTEDQIAAIPFWGDLMLRD
jgi:hypothetical protein